MDLPDDLQRELQAVPASDILDKLVEVVSRHASEKIAPMIEMSPETEFWQQAFFLALTGIVAGDNSTPYTDCANRASLVADRAVDEARQRNKL